MPMLRIFAVLVLALAPVEAAFAAGGSSSSGPSNRIQANFTLDGEGEEAGEDDGHGGGHGGEHGGGESSGDNPRAIDMPMIAVPAIEDGRLRTYLFLSVRMFSADGVDPWRLREQTHFMRDAIIRAGHRTNLADMSADRHIDEALAREILMQAIIEAVGEDRIERLEIINVEAR